LFTFIEKRKAPEAQVTFQINVLDTTAKKAVLYIENQGPLVDFWVFSKTQDLHFEQNFQTLLPGHHVLEFTYQDQLPTPQELGYLLR
jgi:frataxin-like iron-binding protein CyaY